MKKRNGIIFLLIGLINVAIAIGMKSKGWFNFISPPAEGFIYKSTGNSVQFKLSEAHPQSDTYLWNFGNGATSTLANPSYTYAAANSYQVSLKITSGGTSITYYKKVTTLNFPSPISYSTNAGCTNIPVYINYTTSDAIPANAAYEWDLGDATPIVKTKTAQHVYTAAGAYNVKFKFKIVLVEGRDTNTYNSPEQTKTVTISNCQNGGVTQNCCDGSFAPLRGNEYVLSAWVKEVASGFQHTVSYITPSITISFDAGDDIPPFKAKGLIIEGWQRIEGTFKVPEGATTIDVGLNNEGNEVVYFDDVRIFPTKGNMKSFVYDPSTKRLMAELDQNNYATLYEYDEEGNMVRVKRETERGIMTVSESRSSLVKKK